MDKVRVYGIRTHSKAELSCEEFEDRLMLTLKHKETRKTVSEVYYKLDTGIDIGEASKIDIIVHHMHGKIGLDLWDE